MDQGTEPIRQDIDQIRASMTDKMERIEAKIKGTVDETTGSVKRMVDVKYQVSEHPWAALGISVLAGIALGSLGDSKREYHHTSRASFGGMSSTEAYEQARNTSPYPPNYGTSSYGPSSYGPSSYGPSSYGPSSYGPSSYGQQGQFGVERHPFQTQSTYTGDTSHQAYSAMSHPNQYGGMNGPTSSGGSWDSSVAAGAAGGAWNANAFQSSKPGMVDQLTRQFGGEIETLKTAAVTSLVGVIRDTIRQNFPSMYQEMERMRRDQGASRTGASFTTGSGSMSSGVAGAGSADYAHSTSTTSSYETKSGHPDDIRRGGI